MEQLHGVRFQHGQKRLPNVTQHNFVYHKRLREILWTNTSLIRCRGNVEYRGVYWDDDVFPSAHGSSVSEEQPFTAPCLKQCRMIWAIRTTRSLKWAQAVLKKGRFCHILLIKVPELMSPYHTIIKSYSFTNFQNIQTKGYLFNH